MSPCSLPIPAGPGPSASSPAWWWASRACTLLFATIVAAILRCWVPNHTHLVSDWGVLLVGVLAWMAALAATCVAAIQDLHRSPQRADTCGTLLIAIQSAQALVLTVTGVALATIPRSACDLFGPSVRSFFETVSAVLVAGLLTGGTLGVLTALVCDKHRQRAVEMFVVVSIVFALIGVAVPMTQSGISEAPRAKARQDLDTIRNAITLHDSQQNRPLAGTSLKPLLGRYLQEIPKDPWGNDYMLDASMGLVMGFGADQKAGGTEEDQDLIMRYRPALRIQKVVYGRGGAKAGEHHDLRLEVLFNKPFALTGDPVPDLVVLVGPRGKAVIPLQHWRVVPGAGDHGFSTVDGSDPGAGLLVLEYDARPTSKGHDRVPVLIPGAALDVRRSVLETRPEGELRSRSVIRELVTPGGPCDPTVHGSEVVRPDGAHPHDLVGTEERGELIERLD